MEFLSDNTKNFQINGKSYTIHNFALTKASIFEALRDTNQKNCDIPVPGANVDDIEKILKLLYGYKIIDIFAKTSIKNIIHLSSIMMFMGIDVKDVKNCITQMLDNVDIIEDIILSDSYHDCLPLILEMCQYKKEYPAEKFDQLVELIKTMSFPNSFKILLIAHVIVRSLDFKDYDFIMGIKFDYQDTKIDLRDILSVCKCCNDNKDHSKLQWSEKPKELYKKYLKIEPKFFLSYNDTMNVTRITINEKSAELVQHTKTFTKGTMGSNILMSIAYHIAKVLLGLEKL